MKQVTVISGKGGTGKTSITAAFASIAKNTVFADCDVDAADLHLILKPKIKKTINFHGLKIASFNMDKCIDCKKCFESCKFNAISENITFNSDLCEGCGVCSYVCPVDAITGQPIPGGPSIRIRSILLSSAILFALFLTTVTSLPDASSAVFKTA